MIFGWLDKKISQSQKIDSDHFLISLKGADPDLIDTVHGTAMFWSVFQLKHGYDLYGMENWLITKPFFVAQLVSMIKSQQKLKNFNSATGLMVWLHSANALLYPEFRLMGRELWEELGRSTSNAEMYAENSCELMKYETPTIDRRRIPGGLEKLQR